jgi:CysZ protein
VLQSPLYVGKGALFIWSHRQLWKYAAIPVFISVLIFGGSYFLLYEIFVRFVSPYAESQWYGRVLYYLALVLLAAALMVAFFFLFGRVASAVAAPFNDLLSQKIEELLTGKLTETPFSLIGLLKDSGRTLAHSLKILALYVFLLVLGLFLLLIPVIGAAFYSAFGVLLSSYLIAYEYLGYPMDRRRYSWKQKRALLRSRLLSALGFGLGNLAVASIPVVNFLFIPAAVAGGTMLFLDLTAHDDISRR